MVALLAGWIWGTSGQSDAARALETAELKSELLGARAAILDARVAIYSVNFGEASGHLENARGSAASRGGAVQKTWPGRRSQTGSGRPDGIDDAQRMAGKLDQSANSRAGDAAKMLADLLTSF